MPRASAPDFLACATRVLICLLAALLAPTAAPADRGTAPEESYEFGGFALYVPAAGAALRGVLLALGGPDTRAFATDGSFGAPMPELETSLHALGRDLRALATDQGIAILGISRHGPDALPNRPASDALIFEALDRAAAVSGRSELASAPVLVYGISGGAAQAAGFTARNPTRVGALLLKVPVSPERLGSSAALAVPTYLLLAGEDSIADNRAVIAAFEFNRRAGALWAVAIEPGVPHHSLTPAQRAVTVNWLRTIAERRLGASARSPLQAVPESSGWLGHPQFGVSEWDGYPGDRNSANWFPSRATAGEWWLFTSGTDAR